MVDSAVDCRTGVSAPGYPTTSELVTASINHLNIIFIYEAGAVIIVDSCGDSCKQAPTKPNR